MLCWIEENISHPNPLINYHYNVFRKDESFLTDLTFCTLPSTIIISCFGWFEQLQAWIYGKLQKEIRMVQDQKKSFIGLSCVQRNWVTLFWLFYPGPFWKGCLLGNPQSAQKVSVRSGSGCDATILPHIVGTRINIWLIIMGILK